MAKEITMIKNRLEWLLPKENLGRVKLKGKDKLIVYADIHKMGCKEAGKFITNLIAVIRESFTLRIIHGFNHGTVLKEMLYSNFQNSRITERKSPCENPGITVFTLSV